MRTSFAPLWVRSLSKIELAELIADVKRGKPDATATAISFVAHESFGLWHNRARAKLCRFFKNHPPCERDRTRLVDAIQDRLLEGRFYEQFKDQLSMAIRFSPDRLAEAASIAAESDREYIRRYGHWVLHVIASTTRAGG